MPRKKLNPTQGNLAQQIFNADIATDLYSIAQEYLARGWSVIPLRPDKTPAIPWTPSQYHAADEQQLAEWFATGQHKAIGIMCGKVSRLAVLDLDNLERADAFRRQLPHLAETREIRSGHRRAPHFYYNLPNELLNIPTSRAKGIGDFQGRGAYVVAYPTVIDGGMWELVNDAPLYTLTKHDHARILEFLGIGKEQTPTPIVLPKPLSPDDVVAVYQRERDTRGRNEAAYRAALTARKTLSAQDTIAALAAVFIADPAPPGHKPQSEKARYTELVATVHSAYGAAYDAATGQYQDRNRGLPNSAREYLLQHNGVHQARILDMLYMTGLEPGQCFNERSAVECGKHIGIGHATIRKVLDWLEGIQRTITGLRPGAGAANAACASPSEMNLFSELPIYTWLPANTMYCMWQIGEFNRRGRPTKRYILPDPADICTALGVPITPGDKLEISDLRSAAAYRAGLTRAIVTRRENKPMPRKWQAERLGVSIRTAYSYDKDAGIEAIPDSEITPIHWHNINRVPIKPPEGKRVGYYLRIDGVNHAPRRFIAADALSQGKKVEYVERRANKYRLKRDA